MDNRRRQESLAVLRNVVAIGILIALAIDLSKPAPERTFAIVHHLYRYVSGEISRGEFEAVASREEFESQRGRKPGPFDEALWKAERARRGFLLHPGAR